MNTHKTKKTKEARASKKEATVRHSKFKLSGIISILVKLLGYHNPPREELSQYINES